MATRKGGRARRPRIVNPPRVRKARAAKRAAKARRDAKEGGRFYTNVKKGEARQTLTGAQAQDLAFYEKAGGIKENKRTRVLGRASGH